MKNKHKHHIKPRHAGGTDDPSNIVELSVEEHALAHKALYEQHGAFQDFVAWKMLSGQIGKEEAIAILISEGGKRGGKNNVEKNKNAKRGMWSDSAKQKAKERTAELEIYAKGGRSAGKKHVESGHLKSISSLGGKGCKGLQWFHDPVSKQEKNLRTCPNGWKKGRLNPPSFPKHVLANGKGSSWWHCPISKKSKMIKPEMVPPEGWLKGRTS